jgi:RNA polymerase sigma-70 factor (ECF subfamily)
MQVPSADLEPDRELEGVEVGEALEVAISELDPVYRSAIVLRHVEGKSYDEIADILDMPLGTVKTTIFRARKSLRQKLKRLLPGHDLKR